MRVDNNSAFGEDFKWVTYPEDERIVGRERGAVLAVAAASTRCDFARRTASRVASRLTFSALRTFTPVADAGANAVTPGSIGNPDLKPERGKELEIGFETKLWNRLTLDFTYFNKKTMDAIVNQPVAPSSGFSGTPTVNLGRVDNHGFELQATLQAIDAT